MKYYIGVDLGGTNIAVGICDENCNIIKKASRKTKAPRPAQEIAEDIVGTINDALALAGLSMEDTEWIGIGSPGDVDTVSGSISLAANLGFRDVPLAEMIQNLTGKTTFIDNDATAAAYGEFIAGAGKNYKSVLMVTLGTGVGGGVIIDGKTYGKFSGADNEIGHMGIAMDGRLCTCGRKGCAEAYCSATGLILTTKEYMEKYPSSKMWELAGGNLDNVNGRIAFDAMRAGDEAGKLVVDEYISQLAYAVTSYVNIFEPELVIIGGGICHEGETLLAPLRQQVFPNILARFNPKRVPKIIKAELGNDAGIIGAAMLGFNC